MGLDYVSKDVADSSESTLKVTGIDADTPYLVVLHDIVPSTDERLGVRVTKSASIQSDANYDNGRRGFVISGSFQSNADTGENICGFREKDVLTKWLNGEHIPAPPRVKGRMPKPPLQGASEKEETTWTGEYNKWLQENDHMGEDFKSKQRKLEQYRTRPQKRI